LRSDVVNHFLSAEADPLIRLSVTMDGHTYIYQYRRCQTPLMREALKNHVELGKTDPYASLILLRMMKQCESQ